MTNIGKAGKAIGTMVSGLEARILGWIGAHVSLTPRAFGTWLDEHKFIRLENGSPVTDYAGFFRWTRNSLLSLVAMALLYEAYTMVIGTFNNTPIGLGVSLGIGVVVFGITSVVWIWKTIGRINQGLAWILILATAALDFIALGTPTYQYYTAQKLSQLSADDVRNLIAAGIPRIWAMRGFCLLSLIIMPLAWMTTLGPALLSLAFAKSKEGLEEVWGEIQKVFSHTQDTEDEGAQNLRKRAAMESGLLMLTWAVLALFVLSMLLSSTVWGPFGALVIGTVSIVVVWIRRFNAFLGNFLTKALYGVATGGLLFVCFLYGLSLSALMLAPDLVSLNVLTGIKWTSFVVGLGSALGVLFNSTTAAEQIELDEGNGHTEKYTKKVTGFGTDGQPIYEAVNPKPMSFSWLRNPILWIGLVVALWFVWTQVFGKPNPLDKIDFNVELFMGIGAAALIYGVLFGSKTATTNKEH